MSIDLFNQLGDEIERRWLATNYSEIELPAIAKSALEEFDLPSKTTPWEAVEWALSVRELPTQRDLNAHFAQPPVTLYNAPRFHIDIYFWFTSTTALHQHAFCGAFQVFEGSSLHSWYEFERDEAVNMFTETGKLDLKVCQILGKGATQEIWPGRQYIHSLFHLDEPSATIVVRTHRSPLEQPQFSYYKPGLAVDPFFDDDTTAKKRQLVIALLQARRPDADDLIEKLLNESDFQSSFVLLTQLRGALGNDQIQRAFGVETGKERFERRSPSRREAAREDRRHTQTRIRLYGAAGSANREAKIRGTTRATFSLCVAAEYRRPRAHPRPCPPALSG